MDGAGVGTVVGFLFTEGPGVGLLGRKLGAAVVRAEGSTVGASVGEGFGAMTSP